MNKLDGFIKIAYRPMPILKSYARFQVSCNSQIFKEKWGLKISIKNILIINGDWYFKQDEFSKFKEKVGKYVIQSPSNLIRIANRCYKDSKKLFKLAKQVKNVKTFLVYRDFADKWWPYIMIIYGGEDYYENYLKSYLEERLRDQKKIDEYFKILVRPVKENVVFIEKRELLKIGSAIQRNFKNYSKLSEKNFISKLKSSKLLNRVYKHFLKYQWLSTRGYRGKEWQFEDIVSRLRNFLKTDCQKELEKIARQRREARKLYWDAIRELKPDEKAIRFIRTAGEFLYFRTYRTDALHQADFINTRFLLDLCAKHNFEFEDLVNLTKNEIFRLSNEEFSSAEIQKLKKHCQKVRKNYALLMLAGKIRLITNVKEVESIKKAVETDYSRIQEIKGTIANTGKVRGRIKIVESNQDIKKVQERDIMVTAMTHPNYIVAMEKASAFVTDEGGITCHAAIVSREMNKPCIIGTKIATKVLKDGQLVEVDANRGIVKILKK